MFKNQFQNYHFLNNIPNITDITEIWPHLCPVSQLSVQLVIINFVSMQSHTQDEDMPKQNSAQNSQIDTCLHK